MGWYFRKSVSVGPVRFNISRNGIGTSVGVKGFRVGVKSNGKGYINAGRNGFYYRQEFGNNDKEYKGNIEHEIYQSTNIIHFKTTNSIDLSNDTKQDLIEKLNNSYKTFRFDYLICALFLFITLIGLLYNNVVLSIGSTLICIIATTLTAIWESKRRTVNIEYEFENNDYSQFEKIIEAFNQIAGCQRIWSLLTARHLYDTHESKLNAGANQIIDRGVAFAGNGEPPWVNTNVTTPIIKTGNRSLYFMPDGILVYDNLGVGMIDYSNLIISFNTVKFIEETPPADTQIVDTTWRFPNRNGGPDRRFNNNYQMSVCLYGELKLEIENSLILYVMTSQANAPAKFHDEMSARTMSHTRKAGKN